MNTALVALALAEKHRRDNQRREAERRREREAANRRRQEQERREREEQQKRIVSAKIRSLGFTKLDESSDAVVLAKDFLAQYRQYKTATEYPELQELKAKQTTVDADIVKSKEGLNQLAKALSETGIGISVGKHGNITLRDRETAESIDFSMIVGYEKVVEDYSERVAEKHKKIEELNQAQEEYPKLKKQTKKISNRLNFLGGIFLSRTKKEQLTAQLEDLTKRETLAYNKLYDYGYQRFAYTEHLLQYQEDLTSAINKCNLIKRLGQEMFTAITTAVQKHIDLSNESRQLASQISTVEQSRKNISLIEYARLIGFENCPEMVGLVKLFRDNGIDTKTADRHSTFDIQKYVDFGTYQQEMLSLATDLDEWCKAFNIAEESTMSESQTDQSNLTPQNNDDTDDCGCN